MQKKSHPVNVGILVQMIDMAGIKRRGAADDAVHLGSFCKQELSQVTAVLPGDASDQSLGHFYVCLFRKLISSNPQPSILLRVPCFRELLVFGIVCCPAFIARGGGKHGHDIADFTLPEAVK